VTATSTEIFAANQQPRGAKNRTLNLCLNSSRTGTEGRSQEAALALEPQVFWAKPAQSHRQRGDQRLGDPRQQGRQLVPHLSPNLRSPRHAHRCAL